MAFAHNDAIKSFLEIAGSAGLPLVSVDGVTVATGRYPTRAELPIALDTAPTGHTLLLDATGSYHREIARQMGDGGQYTTPLCWPTNPSESPRLKASPHAEPPNGTTA